jgi:Pyridoxamine 5'-phosphate oxidase
MYSLQFQLPIGTNGEYNGFTYLSWGGSSMAETVSQTLSEDLFSLLQQERFVTLATIDHETGAPSLHSLSWTYAESVQKVCFAIDNRSRILANIAKQPEVALHLIGAGSSYAVNGRAVIKADRLPEVPLKLAMVEMMIYSVRDIMFYGSRICVEPQYEKTYDKKAAMKLDSQVMAALRKGL